MQQHAITMVYGRYIISTISLGEARPTYNWWGATLLKCIERRKLLNHGGVNHQMMDKPSGRKEWTVSYSLVLDSLAGKIGMLTS